MAEKSPLDRLTTLRVSFPHNGVALVELFRPAQKNAMSREFWEECRACFDALNEDERARVIVVSSATPGIFSAGLDLTSLPFETVDPATGQTRSLFKTKSDGARLALALNDLVGRLQAALSAIEACRAPVIAAVDGPCVGSGVDLITACDIRYCTNSSWFSVKEVDLGLAADVGTLQRLPKVVGSASRVREWCFTGRRVPAAEAAATGLVSGVFDSRNALLDFCVRSLAAEEIARKSPVAVVGTKKVLNYSRDHSVRDGLEHVALWNSAMLQTRDLEAALRSARTKSAPTFSKL